MDETKETKDKDTKIIKVEKPPYETLTQAALYAMRDMLNPPRGKEIEYSNIPEFMVFPLVSSAVRQAAANPYRNIITEPLSGIFTSAYCAVRCAVGSTRKAMMVGQLANSKMSASDSELPDFNNPTKNTPWR